MKRSEGQQFCALSITLMSLVSRLYVLMILGFFFEWKNVCSRKFVMSWRTKWSENIFCPPFWIEIFYQNFHMVLGETLESRSEILGKFWNVTVEKEREDQLDWCLRNKVLYRVMKERNILHKINRRKANWIAYILRWNCLLKYVREGKKLEGRICDGKTMKKM